MRLVPFLAVSLSLVAFHTAAAQRAQPVGFTPHSAAQANVQLRSSSSATLPGNTGTPRWVRWGLVGAIGGAVLFTIAGSSHSAGSNLLAGAATGFIVVGGGVLLYDSICSGSSGGSGFCGR